jgi:hypothetical protein
MANIPRITTVLKRDAMQSAWIQPLVTNVIRAVKINVSSYPWWVRSVINWVV